MLYVSTRSKSDSYTAYRALHQENAPDGGQFVPFRIPEFTAEDLQMLQEKTFGDIVAQILNLFFSARLTGWDVDCCVGRNPVRLEQMNHRLIVAEAWHNPDRAYESFEKSLYCRLCGDKDAGKPTQWARIAIYIAVLFALHNEISADGIEQMDIAVNTGDFVLPMAAYYARQMGLPLGKIICACNENGAVWDLIHRGEFNTNAPLVQTHLKELDITRPDGIERLVHATLGIEAVDRYLQTCGKKGTFRLDEESLSKLNTGLFSAVVGTDRTQTIINSIYRTNQYLTDPYTALTYGGLQDYRSRTGDSQYTLLLAHHDPYTFAGEIASAIGVSASELRIRISKNKE